LQGALEPVFVENTDAAFDLLKTRIRPGDVLLTQGAGNIGALALQLSEQDWV
jgi:UDP-N-acetylmuramate--alanine ligase